MIKVKNIMKLFFKHTKKIIIIMANNKKKTNIQLFEVKDVNDVWCNERSF